MSDAAVAGALLPGFDGTALPAWVARRLEAGLAGVCLFGHNIVDAPQLRALTDAIVSHNPQAIIALDEEGGDVTRLYYSTGSPWPGNAWLGRFDDEAYTFEVAADIARHLRAVGCNLNFAPSADVNSHQANPVIGVRSFSSEPAVAARHTNAWVRGHQSVGIAASAKHFPGHGDTHSDSHLALPVVRADTDTLMSRDIAPFEAAIEAGVWSIMTSHIMLPALDAERPATFSPTILGDLLRGRLGFEGVVVSDALDMAGASADTGIPEAAVRALAGGCDLLCIGSDNSDDQVAEIEAAVDAAVDSGRLAADRLADATARVASLAAQLSPSRSTLRPGLEPGLSAAAGSQGGIASADLARAAAGFEVSERAGRLLAAHRTARPGWAVVQLQTTANKAVGLVPWGPASVRSAGEVAIGDRHAGQAGPFVTSRRDGEGVEAVELVSRVGERPLAVVGRDIHRHAWAAGLVDDLRAIRPDVLVVDMGWPDDRRSYADIATFGASRLLSTALMAVLGDDIDVAATAGTPR